MKDFIAQLTAKRRLKTKTKYFAQATPHSPMMTGCTAINRTIKSEIEINDNKYLVKNIDCELFEPFSMSNADCASTSIITNREIASSKNKTGETIIYKPMTNLVIRR